MVGIAAKCHRQRANLFDQLVRLYPILFPNHIAQNPAQKADVFHQGTLVVFAALGRLCGRCFFHGSGVREWEGLLEKQVSRPC